MQPNPMQPNSVEISRGWSVTECRMVWWVRRGLTILALFDDTYAGYLEACKFAEALQC